MRRFEEVLHRANALQGTPIPEVADAYSRDLNPKNMGAVGQLLEEAILGELDFSQDTDWTEFGVEIKAVPIGDNASWKEKENPFQPHEDTRITVVRFPEDLTTDFYESTVFHRVRSILFAPVFKHRADDQNTWHLRSPFIWMPSRKALDAVKSDFYRYREAVQTRTQNLPVEEDDGLTGLSSILGRGHPKRLFVKTQYSTPEDWREFEFNGQQVRTRPRAWYFRPAFTEGIIRDNVPLRR